jgi:double-strand break repair protein MRE11
MAPSAAVAEDANNLRILIATDNHLGVHEKDQVRKDDAFITFREIFEIAKQQRVDAVFLGGDLFDVNKPSRETMVRTMEILQEYCLNDDPVRIEVLSDQTVNFPRCARRGGGVPRIDPSGDPDSLLPVDSLTASDPESARSLSSDPPGAAS